MRELGIAGVSGREGRRRRRKAGAPESEPAADLVQREFTADETNQIWFADITYVPTWEGWPFFAVVIDACTKRIVGWSMRDDLKADIVVDALGMGTTKRGSRSSATSRASTARSGGTRRSATCHRLSSSGDWSSVGLELQRAS
jgi:transposase InsO family protein